MRESPLRTTFFLTLLVGALVLVFFILRPYLVTLSIAATTAIVLQPVYEKIVEWVRGRRSIAALLVVLLTIILVLIPLSLLAIQIATEATNVYTAIRGGSASFPTDLIATIEDFIQRTIPGLSLDLSQYAGQALSGIALSLQFVFFGTVRTIGLFFLGIFAYYYMLKDGKHFIETLIELSPLNDKEDRKILSRLSDAVNSVIRGSLIIALIQGCVTGIGLMIFGIPSAVLLGSIAAVCALIPSVGTAVVIGPVILYLLIIGSFAPAVGLLLWGAIAVGLIDNLLHPFLIGRRLKMHPAFIFFSVIGGISFFGIAGFILGPLVVSLLTGLLDIFRSDMKNSATT